MKSGLEIISILKNNSVSFATVSGIVTTKAGVIRRIDEEIPEFSVLTTKSYQINPNRGNREPIIVEPEEGSFGNAVGLRNPGMIKGYEDILSLRSRHSLSAVLNISVSGNSVEEFITLINKFEDIADIIELNLSCPHAAGGYGMAIGTDPEMVYSYIKQIRDVTETLIFPKLTPNVESISEIALAAVEAGADGITAINSVGPKLYLEPSSGEPVLNNSKGNRGGMSGRWVKEIALEKVAEIRNAVGKDLPIIGIGGIETGEDVKNMRDAGADVVGIGSVFASIHPDSWKSFFTALKSDAENGTASASVLRTKKRKMDYKPYKIAKIIDLPGDVRLLELNGGITLDSSQFAFLWLPGIGEKPFSVAKGSPLTFIIRKKGKFTSAVMDLTEHDNIWVRGMYGKDSPDTDKNKAYISAGGTGIAVALELAEKLFRQGKEVHTFYGMSSSGQKVLEEDFLKYGSFTAVADHGKPGRVLDVLEDNLAGEKENCAHYTMGPLPFMRKASELFTGNGGKEEDLFLSIETPTRCGVGLCGECECDGHLTCREGTFFSYSYLNQKQIIPEELLSDYEPEKIEIQSVVSLLPEGNLPDANYDEVAEAG